MLDLPAHGFKAGGGEGGVVIENVRQIIIAKVGYLSCSRNIKLISSNRLISERHWQTDMQYAKRNYRLRSPVCVFRHALGR